MAAGKREPFLRIGAVFTVDEEVKEKQSGRNRGNNRLVGKGGEGFGCVGTVDSAAGRLWGMRDEVFSCMF